MTDFKSTYTDFETIKHMLFYVSTEMLSEEKLQINWGSNFKYTAAVGSMSQILESVSFLSRREDSNHACHI
jgi:hypothetical protein